MYDFSYKNASSVDDAINTHKSSEDGAFLAGGQTLLPTLKQRLAQPSDLIDLSGIGSLSNIEVGEVVKVGAMTTHAEVATSKEIQKALPALSDLAEGIGDPQVRNRGTIGGSVANNKNKQLEKSKKEKLNQTHK